MDLRVIVQGGYMSGDMFGVAASMLFSKNVCVLLLEGTKQAYTNAFIDQAQTMKAYYESCLNAQETFTIDGMPRVQLKQVDDPLDFLEKLKGKQDPLEYADSDDALSDLFQMPQRGKHTVRFFKIGKGTAVVAASYDEKVQQQPNPLKHLVDSTSATTSKIQGFLNTKGLLSKDHHYVALWIRVNKKKPRATAHLELDTSIEGVRQLVADLNKRNAEKSASAPAWKICLVGDRFEKFQAEKDKAFVGCIDLLEFWKHGYWGQAGLGRRQQLTFFKLWHETLAAKGRKVVHLGMRSGALEGPALLGQPTLYLEDSGNQQQARMEKWTTLTRMKYRRVELSQLPTRTGQAIKEVMGGRNKGLGDPGFLERSIDDCNGETWGTNRKRLDAAKEALGKKDIDPEAFKDLYYQEAWKTWKVDPSCEGYKNVYEYLEDLEYGEGTGGFWTALEGLVLAWYDVRVSKSSEDKARAKGFVLKDRTAILGAIKTQLPDPPPLQAVVQQSAPKNTQQVQVQPTSAKPQAPKQVVTNTPKQVVTNTPKQVVITTPKQVVTNTPKQVVSASPKKPASNDSDWIDVTYKKNNKNRGGGRKQNERF